MFKPALATEINALRNAAKDAEAAETAAWADALTVDDFKADLEYEETLAITRGETKITLLHHGHAHTDNDTIVHLPDLNIVHMGDLFFHRMYPFIDRDAGANTMLWRGVVRKAMDLCDDKTVVIPGHGVVSDRAGLTTQIDFFDHLQELVEKAMRDGQGKATIGQLRPERFEGYGLEMLREPALTAMYDELAAAMH
jgi:glyoxylase-like metal-dependent hydrolase (beta-lactamase superfamily II)